MIIFLKRAGNPDKSIVKRFWETELSEFLNWPILHFDPARQSIKPYKTLKIDIFSQSYKINKNCPKKKSWKTHNSAMKIIIKFKKIVERNKIFIFHFAAITWNWAVKHVLSLYFNFKFKTFWKSSKIRYLNIFHEKLFHQISGNVGLFDVL